MRKRICVIGGGRWGKNHIKTLHKLGNLCGVVETDGKTLQDIVTQYHTEGFLNIEEAIDRQFDGYIIATPAETHYPIGKNLLERGLNVLIEKPMALSSLNSGELMSIAEKTGAKLMTGHLLLFHPAIKKIKEMIESGKLGRLHYIYSNRLNFGTVRTEENVFWSFAPHDISVLDYLIGKQAVSIEAVGSEFLQSGICDFTMTHITYPENVHAHIFVSWIHPFKEQRLVVIGSRGMVSFDDSSEEKIIYFYDKHIDVVFNKPVITEKPAEKIFYEKAMPLEEELKYFIENLNGKIEISDGKSGHEVVKVLERVQEILMNKKV